MSDQIGGGTKVKDWISISISVFALFIAAVTACFNLFLQTYDLSVLIEGYTRYEFDKGTKKLIPHPNYTMTFVNAGNRGVSVSNILIAIEQAKGEDKSLNCERAGVRWSSFAIDPFAVKAGDVLIQKADRQVGSQWLENFDGKWSQDRLTILVCAGFSVIAPNSTRRLIAVEIDRSVIDVKFGAPVVLDVDFDADRVPAILLKNWKVQVSGLSFP